MNTDSRKFSRMQWRVLIATMIGYTLFYFMRKNFSFAMPGLEQDCGITKSELGDFLFWGGIVYGVSKFLNGFVGDRVNSRKMLCFGLSACILVNIAFGFVPNFTSGHSTVLAFGILLILNQFFQGTGFPPCARLIAFWVPPKELATKMSVWNTS
ncbi:MAG: MFS transporter, partial [Kiritimatiellae bacterium]|nr:MFS transporter [Kiritimatiellia bacterium]